MIMEYVTLLFLLNIIIIVARNEWKSRRLLEYEGGFYESESCVSRGNFIDYRASISSWCGFIIFKRVFPLMVLENF